MVALVTPFDQQGNISFDDFETLLEFHIEKGTNAIVVAGTTGESATLSTQEKLDLFKRAVSQVNGRVPVIAGTSKDSTKETIAFSQQAEQLGVDGLLIMTPAYIKPTQHGLIKHYKLIAENTNLPIILYNVPGRTACDLLPESIAALSEIEQIVAVKEASGNFERVSEILSLSKGNLCVLSGEDSLTLEMIKKGAKGVISVTANVLPKAMHQMCALALQGDFAKARLLQETIQPLHEVLFIESNPIPVKWLVAHLLEINGGLRLPLTELLIENQTTVQAVFEKVVEAL